MDVETAFLTLASKVAMSISLLIVTLPNWITVPPPAATVDPTLATTVGAAVP
jgi:hypothetical protein